MVTLKEEYKMSKLEIEEYNALPDNLPENKLTAKQIELVDRLYRKYIGGKITMGWGTELYQVEKSEKWPSGPRVKTHEAKRFVLGNLVEKQDSKRMNYKKAAQMFWSAITCRPAYGKLIQEIYNVPTSY